MKTWFTYTVRFYLEMDGLVEIEKINSAMEPCYATQSECLEVAKKVAQQTFVDNPEYVMGEIEIWGDDGIEAIDMGTTEVRPEVQEFEKVDMFKEIGLDKALNQLKSLVH